MTKTCCTNQCHPQKLAIKINAIIAAFAFIYCIFEPNIILPAFLALDYFFRSRGKCGSIINRISKALVKILKLNTETTHPAPKQFAAAVGFIMSILIILSFQLDLILVYQLLCGAMIFFSLLEGIFDFCFACWFYPTFNLIKGKIKNCFCSKK